MSCVAGKVTQTQQSANGSILRTTSATWTRAGKPETATDADGNTTRYRYDGLDRLVSVTDPMARTTTYAYDRLGRRVSAANPAIQAAPLDQQTFTLNGQRASLTDANANTTAFAYDGLDRLATTTFPGGSTEVLTYDASGNVLTRKTRAGPTIGYAYDTLNRLATRTPPSPWPTVSYAYDLAGRQTSVSDTSPTIASAVPPGGSTVAYATTTTYDRLNRPTAVAFDPVPAAASPTAGPVVTFGHSYNKANQRTGESATDSTWIGYPAAAPATTAYSANGLNQYTAVGAVTPTYDGNGNLTFDGAVALEHDAENRLVSATDGSTGAAYAFDGRGRRKLKAVGEASVTISVTDADNREVLEYDGLTGALRRWHAYGPGPNAVVSQVDLAADTRTTPIPNLLGSIVGAYDSAGALARYGYQPYGSGSPAPQFAYTGQRIDPETGGLYYYRARHYSTAWGRFLQPDPAGYRGGRHLYGYVSNDPLNFVDPSGMYVEVAVNGNDVRLTLPIRFAGGAATAENVAAYTREIQRVWSGQFGKYSVTTVVADPSPSTPSSRMNTFTVRQVSLGRSQPPATSNAIGGNQATFNQGDMGAGVMAHEAGHMMGLIDRYRTTQDPATGERLTVPLPGYGGNIMAENSGSPSERDIQAIINAYGPSAPAPLSSPYSDRAYPAPSIGNGYGGYGSFGSK